MKFNRNTKLSYLSPQTLPEVEYIVYRETVTVNDGKNSTKVFSAAFQDYARIRTYAN